MIARTVDLGGISGILLALATLLTGFNTFLNGVQLRRQRAVKAKQEQIEAELHRHYGRIEDSYDIMAREATALTAYIQGLNTTPSEQKREGDK